MTATEAQLEIRRIVDELLRQGEQKDMAPLARVAAQISELFGVVSDEVAILARTKDGRYLRFLIPTKLQQVGQIPISSATSLAARTAREKKPELVNRFSVTPHASVFEAVPLLRQRGEPIQKIMSVPVSQNGELVGVIQICRKAKTAAEAGPDFTQQHLRELIIIGEMLAPCLSLFANV